MAALHAPWHHVSTSLLPTRIPHAFKHHNRTAPLQVAVFYVNKLRVAGIQAEPLNLHFEQIFEVGVDEVRAQPLACGAAG